MLMGPNTDHLNDLMGLSGGINIDNLGLITDQVGIAQPTVSACGTGSPTAFGTDNAFGVNTGAGGVTSCTVTFANPGHWANSPICTLSLSSVTPINIFFNGPITTTGFTVSSASDMSVHQFFVICIGR